MRQQRHFFCLWFGEGLRRPDGTYGCGHAGPQCPYGWHRCGRCGSFDHHNSTEGNCVEPPIPIHFELPEEQALDLPALPMPPSSSWQVDVPGFGVKGEGKSGNLGVEVDRPSLVPFEDLPEHVREMTTPYAASSAIAEGPWTSPNIPPPIEATKQEVDEYVAANYRRLANLCSSTPPKVGDSVLWRGVKTGRAGGTSTSVEHFNAMVHGLDTKDGETFVYVT